VSATKVYIYPRFEGADKGEGGVRRVVDAQRKHLPHYGIEIVGTPAAADILACHISLPAHDLNQYSDKPLVVHSHGLYWASFDWGLWALKANAGCMEAIRQADVVTAPSEWVAQAIRRASLRAVQVVGHGIDLDDWEPLRSRHDYVLWNKTRVDPVCDPEPVERLSRLAPNVTFASTFASTAPPPNLKVSGRLPFPKAKELIRGAGVYLATAKETFGIGTVEAMAAGVPVLGWRWGGQPDLVEHKVTGYLAEPEDYDDLLTGLTYCLKHGARLGAAARQVVIDKYQWPAVMEEYADLYKGLAKKSSPPHVSVVVPAYKLEAYLTETLESVQQQTMKDFECIVVDDYSPDRCGEIAERFAKEDKRFKVIHNEENRYLAAALNTGIETARGRYIIPLDADNLLTPNALSVLSKALDKDRSIHVAYGNVEFLEEDGKRWHSGWPMTFRADWQLSRRNMVPSTAMFKRDVWKLTGGYRQRFKTAEDADFWTRATSYGFRAKMVTEADALIYRNREESMSRTNKAPDWSRWYPWADDTIQPPAAVAFDQQGPIPSFDQPKVAVVIPVGPGHAGYLIDAVDSVDGQTFRNFECIVVNDTGESLPYVPSWVKVVETKGRVGVAKARNLGIAATAAPLFLPLDADDRLEPLAIELMLKVYDEFKGYVYCDWFDRWDSEERIAVWETPEYEQARLLKDGCLHAVTALYAKADWEVVGGFSEDLPAWEDWDFALKLASKGLCGTRLPAPLFTYRKETGMRREQNMAAFEESKQAILSRWRDYFEGRKEFMGCGCGKGSVKQNWPQSTALASSPPADLSNRMVVEYVGRKQGSIMYRGRSGQPYRFADAEGERLRYVLLEDADMFARNADFRVRNIDGEHPEKELVSAG